MLLLFSMLPDCCGKELRYVLHQGGSSSTIMKNAKGKVTFSYLDQKITFLSQQHNRDAFIRTSLKVGDPFWHYIHWGCKQDNHFFALYAAGMWAVFSPSHAILHTEHISCKLFLIRNYKAAGIYL